jgi:hypothetical protein
MTKEKQVSSAEELPIKNIESEKILQETDADSGATEGYLGQVVSPDALSGASAI